ncbi:uncharacterized protein LOC143629223 [Bidens hawaiensis]|uniref:uncharacterized protein LOC143629223 n=1 Tax=Bidens hawaiensis TaxID=980011 RepID=UPI00404B3C6D
MFHYIMYFWSTKPDNYMMDFLSRMGGKKQTKKVNLDRATKEASVFFNHSVPARNLRKADLGAVIFGATHNTINECISNKLFGLPEGHYSYIKNIKQGLVLFLFNYSDRKLHGVFEAASQGQLNIDKYAWLNDGDDTGYTRYPAQVKISVKKLCQPLSEDQFQPVIANNYYESKHFHFELDRYQTGMLVAMFTSLPTNPSVSTKWNSLYAPLLAATKRQEYNAPIVSGMASSLNDAPALSGITSGVSYASALCKTSTATTTTAAVASSSQPAGTWSALFKPEAGTKDELPLNIENEDKGDLLEAPDTWEDSIWAANDMEESERDQTRASNLNPQAHAATDNINVVQGNTWLESQHIAPTTYQVEHGQASYTSGQHFTKPSSSSEPLDCYQDYNLPLSIDTDESDKDENHEKDNLFIPNRFVETSTDLQSVVAKLMQEFEVMKVSQLKQIMKTNMLEQELDTSRQEIVQLRNRVRFLESGSQPNV